MIIFLYFKELLVKERIPPSGREFFPLREVPILKGTQFKVIIA